MKNVITKKNKKVKNVKNVITPACDLEFTLFFKINNKIHFLSFSSRFLLGIDIAVYAGNKDISYNIINFIMVFDSFTIN